MLTKLYIIVLGERRRTDRGWEKRSEYPHIIVVIKENVK